VILRSLRTRLGVVSGLVLMVVACGGAAPPAGQTGQPVPAPPKVRYANIGGYLLAYECAGTGSPTVILEAGYTASGISTYGLVILPKVPQQRRVAIAPQPRKRLSAALLRRGQDRLETVADHRAEYRQPGQRPQQSGHFRTSTPGHAQAGRHPTTTPDTQSHPG
jgi:hypothetical protein